MNRTILVVLCFSLAHWAHAATLRIPDGDCAALGEALRTGATNIILAAGGHYGYCPVTVAGHVQIDGAGARWESTLAPDFPAIAIAPGARVTIRNLNLVPTPSPLPPAIGTNGCGFWLQPVRCPQPERPIIENEGTLLLDAVSISGIPFDYGDLIVNRGDLTLRNATIAGNSNHGSNSGSILRVGPGGSRLELVHSTIADNEVGPLGVFHSDVYPDKGSITLANSVVMTSGPPVCYLSRDVVEVISHGGNIIGDDSCALDAQGDHVLGDARLGSFGDNGGPVDTVVLTGDSPAVHNGLAANCEASDARGIVRNIAARGGCDAGAYEYGGGRGLLSQGGMNGFFYDASADGHYVTVQRLDWGSALVIWNTFDRDGKAAWIYSIGEVDGTHVHAQGAQNLGGVLQPGGAPTGSHGAVWGDIDIDFSDCFNATFRYASPLPNFGSGQFPLNRLAFLGDLDCSH